MTQTLQVNTLFDRMDAWRHFPNYQLERRADLFFSLYLSEVLGERLGFPVRSDLVPEFPVHIRTIFPHRPTDKSYKIDYVALSAAGDQTIFVELKTEELSRRPEQDRYLKAAQNAGIVRLLGGLLEIFRATTAKRKYFCLLQYLANMELLRIPIRLEDVVENGSPEEVNEASRLIEITAKATAPPVIMYVQPKGDAPDVISFNDFADIIRRHDDPMSLRFATSLCEWSKIQAGEK